MNILFEYGNSVRVADRPSLEVMLKTLWADRYTRLVHEEVSLGEPDQQNQPFLRFDGESARANNYIGFIQTESELIEIYPKVFKYLPEVQGRLSLMQRHIFYWLDYCRKWRFPFAKAALDRVDNVTFPELLINLFSNQFFEAVSAYPFITYQPVQEALQTPKGSINFPRYVVHSASRGNFHLIECDYEPFLFDNNANRVIKYCTRSLLAQTTIGENVRILQDILFILDEVADVPCTLHDVDTVILNPFFNTYTDVLESCKLIAAQQVYSGSASDLSQWSLLLPMEYIFEDFFAGFLAEHISTRWKVTPQKSEMYLSDTPQAFQMHHDLVLEDRSSGRTILVDTKYKLRDPGFKSDPKRGISQSDLYQMVSYAYKRACTEVFLVYPNLSDDIHEPDSFIIRSGFPESDPITVTAIEIPFWSSLGTPEAERSLCQALQGIFSANE